MPANVKYKMQEDSTLFQDETTSQLSALKDAIHNRKQRSKRLWQRHEETSPMSEEEQRKVMGKFTLFVTKHEW